MVPHGVIVFGGTARFPVTTDQVLAFDQARSLSFVCKFTLLDRIGTHGCSWINVRPLKRCHVLIQMEFRKRFTWRDLHVLGHESRSRTDFARREQLIISLSHCISVTVFQDVPAGLVVSATARDRFAMLRDRSR